MEYISYVCRAELGKQLILHLNRLVFDARMMRAWLGVGAPHKTQSRMYVFDISYTCMYYILVGSYKTLTNPVRSRETYWLVFIIIYT